FAQIDSTSAEFAWTPSENQGPGTYEFIVNADDGEKTDTMTVRIRVEEVNENPRLQPPGNRSSVAGDVVALTVTASDPDVPDNVLTFTAEGLPQGVAIDSESGLISGTVSAAAAAGSPHLVS